MADDDDKVDDVDDKVDDVDDYEAPDQETWSKTTEALSKANNEAKKWRLRAQGKDDKWSVPGWQKAKADDDADDDDEPAKKPARRQPKVDADAIRREAEEAALAKAKPGLVKAAAKDAFRAAGLLLPEKGDSSPAIARAFRLLDLDSVDVDEEGDVSGIDEAVKVVKREYPELFARKGARAVNAGAGSGSGDPGQKPAASANKLAAIIRGAG